MNLVLSSLKNENIHLQKRNARVKAFQKVNFFVKINLIKYSRSFFLAHGRLLCLHTVFTSSSSLFVVELRRCGKFKWSATILRDFVVFVCHWNSAGNHFRSHVQEGVFFHQGWSSWKFGWKHSQHLSTNEFISTNDLNELIYCLVLYSTVIINTFFFVTTFEFTNGSHFHHTYCYGHTNVLLS